MLDNWIAAWDKPIGALIETHVSFDRDYVATLQAQLLAIHTIETQVGLSADRKNDLFRLLSQGPNAIEHMMKMRGIGAEEVAEARTIVDAGKGMPREVPSFGLIAKINGLVSQEICDELLTVQAAARMIKFSAADVANVPSLDAAAEDKRFALVGTNDMEPDSLVTAQSYAHLALLTRAAEKQAGYHGYRYDFSHIAGDILARSASRLATFQMVDVAEDIKTAIVELPPVARPSLGQISLHVGRLLGNLEPAEDYDHAAEIISHRADQIDARRPANRSAGGGVVGVGIVARMLR